VDLAIVVGGVATSYYPPGVSDGGQELPVRLSLTERTHRIGMAGVERARAILHDQAIRRGIDTRLRSQLAASAESHALLAMRLHTEANVAAFCLHAGTVRSALRAPVSMPVRRDGDDH